MKVMADWSKFPKERLKPVEVIYQDKEPEEMYVLSKEL